MNYKVLVIEDDSGIRETLCDLLITMSYSVKAASNGQEGLECLKVGKPDLIICDIMMPIMGGMEFLKRVKSDENYWYIPVLMLTAKIEYEDRERAYEIGADDYLVKPFEIKDLTFRIKYLIALRENISSKSLDRTSPLDMHVFLNKLNFAIQINLHQSQLGKVAKELNLSESSLQKKVKFHTEHTFSEYLKRYKLSRARALLESGVCNVSESSSRSGFKNLAHFSDSFKSFYGVSPSKILAEM